MACTSQGATTLDTLRYNAQGDTIAQNTITLNYDAGHRLTGIVGLASYAYDTAGRRVRKRFASLARRIVR